jgi:hypothetical protein
MVARWVRISAMVCAMVPVVGGIAMGQSSSPASSEQALWVDATAATIGATTGWTNKVEIADVDDDGDLDILHANGGLYDRPGPPEAQRVLLNQGPGRPFLDATRDVLGPDPMLARVIKARDVNADGFTDLVIGNTYQTQSRLFVGSGDGRFEDATRLLPEMALSVGDLEVGDVDGDRDLDIVLADWGEGSPMSNAGAPVRLWRAGEGRWVDDSASMPTQPIGFSWDLELVDVDLDWDLDLAVSCKMCDTSRLYLNDGAGVFTDVSAERLPATSNNYELEAMDLDGDGYPELVTINDGPPTSRGFTEHVFRNTGGSFDDATASWWPPAQNPGYDDNLALFLDADSDGDADVLVGSLDGPDRLLRNDGTGALTLGSGAFSGPPTPGTLGMALGDLDGDGRLDVAEGQGEVADPDHVFLGTEALPVDTAAPRIEAIAVRPAGEGTVEVLARVHDTMTPVAPWQFASLTARLGDDEHPLAWSGDRLWRAILPWTGALPSASAVSVCAEDRAGNEACAPA